MNLNRVLTTLPAIGLLVTAVGCSDVIQKSANPLSPTIAGALDGVTFTAPVNVLPAQNSQIKYVDQPITFAFDSASSTSPRPFTMHLQISKEYSFASVVFDRAGFEKPESGNRISFRLPDRLPKGIYYWRVRAEDGANNSDWNPPNTFEALEQVIIREPSPNSPVNNERVSSRTPTLTANNGFSSGPHKAIQYQFQLSTNISFTQVVADGIVGEGSGTTAFPVSTALTYDIAYYWRVRASDGEVTTAWSDIAAFASPATPPPTPTPPAPAPGSGGGSGTGPVPDGWQNCTGGYEEVVRCVHGYVNPGSSATRAFEVTKRVAWLFRGEGMGLLIKNGGENIISWQGKSFAIGRVCYPNGQIYKVLTDVGEGGTNGPGWADNGFVDPSLYVPAINPGEPEPEPVALLSSLSTFFEDTLMAPPALAARRWLATMTGH